MPKRGSKVISALGDDEWPDDDWQTTADVASKRPSAVEDNSSSHENGNIRRPSKSDLRIEKNKRRFKTAVASKDELAQANA